MLAFSDRPSLNGLIIFFFSVSTEQSIFVSHRVLKIGKNSEIMINHFMSGSTIIASKAKTIVF